MPPPLLSICVATWNRRLWLRSSLYNWLPQVKQCEDCVEFLVVDDASDEDIADVIEEAKQWGPFRFYRNPSNLGAVGNFGACAQLAKGQFVWIVGNDDLPRSGTVQHVVDVLKRNPFLNYVNINYTLWEHAQAPDKLFDADTVGVLPARNSDLQERYVERIADLVEGDVSLFMGVYASIWKREMAKEVFRTDLGVWTSLESMAPHSVYIANNLLDKSGYYIGYPYIVNSYDISWGKYALVILLRWTPELLGLFIQCGIPRSKLRKHHEAWMMHCESGLWLLLFQQDIPLRDKISVWFLFKQYGRYLRFYGILFKVFRRLVFGAARKSFRAVMAWRN